MSAEGGTTADRTHHANTRSGLRHIQKADITDRLETILVETEMYKCGPEVVSTAQAGSLMGEILNSRVAFPRIILCYGTISFILCSTSRNANGTTSWR